MTVVAWARVRRYPGLPTSTKELFRVDDGSQVLAECWWQPESSRRPTLLALHGLEGSSGVHYMRGLAHKAWRRGWNVVLLNQRNCGGTEHLSPRLYHSGLTADPRAVLRALVARGLTRVGVVGYSLGGNLSLKLAGELGSTPDVPVRAVVAVCPTIDLDLCVHAIERRVNVGYQWNFMRNLKGRLRRMAAAWPGTFDLAPLDRLSTIREFDEVYTAPHHGFEGASDYYRRASALRVVNQICLPALIISAGDDPFVPLTQFRDAAVASNAHIITSLWPHGGHCGFISRATTDDDGYWAETTAVAFLADRLER
jgi:predicted alpha/beta-fold hydrolase